VNRSIPGGVSTPAGDLSRKGFVVPSRLSGERCGCSTVESGRDILYRLESSADSAEYEDELPVSEKVTNHNNRYGDHRLENGKFRFMKRHLRAIFGVEWEGTGTDGLDDDLDLIDPKVVGEAATRWPTTYVLVAWDVSGELVKTWEPRQALRARWGKESADKAIFSAACEAENRYSEAKVGKRLASSRSPSVGLVEETTRHFREQSPPQASHRALAQTNPRLQHPHLQAEGRRCCCG
jgi:hypothetical protein